MNDNIGFTGCFVNYVNNINIEYDKPKCSGSFKEIFEKLGIVLSQRSLIKIGYDIEKIIIDFLKYKNAKILSRNINGKNQAYQADLYFGYNDKIYYFECKNNVNLDTEKVRSIINKLIDIKNNNVINIIGILSFRNSTANILKKYSKKQLFPYLYGYNDFLDIFGEELNYDEFLFLMETIGKKYKQYNLQNKLEC